MAGCVKHSHPFELEDLKYTSNQRKELKRVLLEGNMTVREICDLPSLNTTTNPKLSGTNLVRKSAIFLANGLRPEYTCVCHDYRGQ